ncbi:MAG: hypothetical protein N3D80_08550 [Ignavibacterium album]|jgi:hypothetical protein|nr:hypothetical protein [Ignavibacterium album]MCX8105902.1 hypothetical protein [Ignavibacterium album]
MNKKEAGKYEIGLSAAETLKGVSLLSGIYFYQIEGRRFNSN